MQDLLSPPSSAHGAVKFRKNATVSSWDIQKICVRDIEIEEGEIELDKNFSTSL